MIWKLVRRNVAATRGRLLLMLLSIVLGVSFVSGSFLLADSLRAIFGDVAESIFEGTDVSIRAVQSDLQTGEDDPVFSDDVLDQIAGVPEIGYAEGGIFAFEQGYTVDPDGDVNRPLGPPVFAGSWGGPSPVSTFNLVAGAAPGPGQIAIDEAQANSLDLTVGDMIGVVGPGLDEIVEHEIAGLVVFGSGDVGVSPYFNLFDLETAQTVLGAEGLINGIAISAADGVSVAELTSAVEAAYGHDPALETVPGTTLVAEQNAEFESFIGIFGNVLLGFAITVLFVSIFIIYNTFAILIGQRIRQFGLLRSVGMTGSQIRNMVLIEALFIGLLASIIGLFGGIGIANGLKWLFSQAGDGGGFPDGPIVFKLRTMVAVFGLGIGVTLLSALIPAWLVQRIPALAALRDGLAARQGSRTRRVAIGAVTFTLGAVALGLGLFGSFDTVARLSLLGAGAALIFIGVAALSVLFAAAATRLLGAPVEAARGLTGRLGRDNASRNPQRTAATATALMIGLALITGVLVLTSSVRSTFNRILDETIAADVLVYEENQGLSFAASAVDRLAASPGVEHAAGVSSFRVLIDGESTGVSGFDLATTDQVLNLQLSEGTYDVGPTGVLLHKDEADEIGLGVGSTVDVVFEDDFADTFTVAGIFDDATLVGGAWVFDRATVDPHRSVADVSFAGARFVEGADAEASQASVEDALATFPQLTVQDNTEFKESQEGQINALLYVIFGLLALCIVVAFIGIVNTMALSILERTREIGLLRAVGTSRKQLRAMVRWEAVIIGVFGALLGVVLGLIIGVAAVTAIPDSFVSEVSVPWVWAIALTVIGGVLGMFAALFPANRAGNMNVLDAISGG